MAVQNPLLTSHLAAVSRSFYLTLKVLPWRVRPQIGLAYLLARTTDTIADTDLVPASQRLEALQRLRERIMGTRTSPVRFPELAGKQSSPAERVLLEKCEAGVSLLETLTPTDQQLVRSVLEVITSGQELDLRRFESASSSSITGLKTPADLDDYTYRVAGCVGEFWTQICRRHLFPKAKLDESLMLRNGVRFGKGLQLVNILRDLPADLRTGRCYIPTDELLARQLRPEDLLDPKNETRFRPLFDSYLAVARGHLEAGWNYTNSLPFGCIRLRLACSWPVLLGMETLRLLARTPVLRPDCRVKVPRTTLRNVMIRTVLFYPFPGMWKGLAPKA